ncbi:initiation factor 2 [Morchella conica CCBAS932]|uniref:Translation initiation factor IF-2, mitochondrial n=2 Tax=Morchella sect. Distantes TaxID=1051054 RepID=A0A3N4KXL9_9PEZI|nr:initiation factor 2 [Morchella conica CCBAS932]
MPGRTTPSQQDGYAPREGYSRGGYNQGDGYNPRGTSIARGYAPREYTSKDRYAQRDLFASGGGYAPRDGYNPGTPSFSETYVPKEQTWKAGDRDESGAKKSESLAQEETITRPLEATLNDYQKRRAGRSRDKSQNRLLYDDFESAILEEGEVLSRKDKKATKKAKKREKKEYAPKMIPLYLPEYISIPNLAKALKVRLEDFTQQMEQMGFTEVSHDHILNAETAGLIAQEFNYEPIIDNSKERDLLPRPPPEDRSILPQRPPVVTIMGHVDHGKTSLLDWLRKASVAATEHGGITQHIGAFSVNMSTGENITFLDTPGHAAFLTMRERGANVTDIVILVVAADDSVMPQTIEAIKHARAANVPIIVAANKIDKEDANVEKVKQDLARYGVDVEDYGGDTQVVCVSAKTGQGMDDLAEAAVTLSEVLDMRAEVDGPCEGWVLEAGTQRGGHIATVLVRRGTLRLGDCIVAGTTWAKVRQLINERGVEVEFATPGTPIQVLGWKDQPEAGKLAIQADSEAKAKDVIEFRIERAERLRQAADMEAINEKRRLHREMEETEATIREEAIEKKEDPDAAVLAWEKTSKKEVAAQSKCQEVGFVVKGDVGGSVEAVVASVEELGNDEVRAKVFRSNFGNVSEFDVDYAAAIDGYVLCFNLTPDPEIIVYARNKGVTILVHNVIYHLIEDAKRVLSDRLSPTVITKITGEADIGVVFSINIKAKVYKPVAGCKVKTGVVTKNSKVRVLRDGETIFEGMLESLKNVKKDVTEMRKGTECGIGFEGWGEFQVGDVVQCYEETFEPRSL